jgi:hypothetical protein
MTIRQISCLDGQARKLQLAILIMLSTRNNFPVNNSFTLDEALNKQNYECNKPAMITFLLQYTDRSERTTNELSKIY